MAKVTVSQRVAADADAVWELIGDFNGLAGWAANVKACAGDGEDVRVVEFADGRRLRERLESFDEIGRSYSYSLIKGEEAAEGRLATLKVWANRDGSAEVVWSAELDPADAAEAAELDAFYRSSLQAVSERFS
jgi:hypothetical protein